MPISHPFVFSFPPPHRYHHHHHDHHHHHRRHHHHHHHHVSIMFVLCTVNKIIIIIINHHHHHHHHHHHPSCKYYVCIIYCVQARPRMHFPMLSLQSSGTNNLIKMRARQRGGTYNRLTFREGATLLLTSCFGDKLNTSSVIQDSTCDHWVNSYN